MRYYFLAMNLLFFGLCLSLIAGIIIPGIPSINFEFLTAGTADAGRAGGVAPILINTAIIVGLSGILTLALGSLIGFHLTQPSERRRPSAKVLSRMLDLLSATPSILFGLIGHVLFSQILGLGYSLLAGALTLSLMCVPFFVRLLEEGFSTIPDEIWHNTEALGWSRYSQFKLIMTKVASPIVATAFVLAIGRGLAETAALSFTSGYGARFPESLLDSGRTLSVHILDLSMNVAGGDQMAFASAGLLLGVSLLFNLSARTFIKMWSTRAQTHKRKAKSPQYAL